MPTREKIDELVAFLKGKISDDDIAEAVLLVNGGVDPDDTAMDQPPYRGRDVPRTGAQDVRLRKLVNDSMARVRVQEHREYQEHRKDLGLTRIRNLGP
jgi:hypothetical protein